MTFCADRFSVSPSIAKLEIEVRHAGRHLRDLHIGIFMQDGRRCYGVSFMHGGKRYELSMHMRHPNPRMVDEGKRHLLETVLADIERRFRDERSDDDSEASGQGWRGATG